MNEPAPSPGFWRRKPECGVLLALALLLAGGLFVNDRVVALTCVFKRDIVFGKKFADGGECLLHRHFLFGLFVRFDHVLIRHLSYRPPRTPL